MSIPELRLAWTRSYLLRVASLEMTLRRIGTWDSAKSERFQERLIESKETLEELRR